MALVNKMKAAFFALAIGFFAAGCASKRINPDYSNEDIRNFHHIAVVEPVLEVYEIGGTGKIKLTKHDEKAKVDFISSLGDFLIKTQSTYYGSNNLNPGQIDSLTETFDSAFFYRDAIKISDLPENLLSIGSEEKVLFLFMYGYYKSKSQRRKEFWKSIGIGVLTLGLFIPIYQEKYVGIHSLMIDKKTSEIVFRDMAASAGDFRDQKSIRKLLDKSIGSYFISHIPGSGKNQ